MSPLNVRPPRAREGEPSSRLWRSPDEIGLDDAVLRRLVDAMPQLASLAPRLGRRDFLGLLGAALAMAGLAACKGPPSEVIVPWRKRPEAMPDAAPEFYATTLDCAGEVAGVLVETHQGRPTKIEGNPLHPASLGATDARMQAAVLELWDPDRSPAPTHRGVAASWNDFAAAAAALRDRADRGASVAIVSGRIASPTLARQRAVLRSRWPGARWHSFEAVDDDAVVAGMKVAFGVPARPHYRFDRAERIVALDADFLGELPGHVRYARDYASARLPPEERGRDACAQARVASRLYVAEPTPSLTGAMADHRWALGMDGVAAFAEQLAAALGVDGASADVPEAVASRDADTIAADLRAHRGAALVVAGPAQPARVHALAQRMNSALDALGRTVELVASDDEPAGAAALRPLVDAMTRGEIDTLVMLDGNPVYATPVSLGFGRALASVPHTIHLGLYADETAAAAEWHLPRTHSLENWSDRRAPDGTASIVQPVIAPLHDARSEHELIALLLGDVRTAHAIVRDTWRAASEGDFDAWWRDALRDGVIAGSRPAADLALELDMDLPAAPSRARGNARALELVIRADASVWDGRYANNAWLQELPRPITQLTWSNAALVSPALARERGLSNGDLVELALGTRHVRVPVFVLPGQAERSVTLSLGYGRTSAGKVGDGRGANANRLREVDSPWRSEGLVLAGTGERVALSSTQQHQRIDERNPVRVANVDDLGALPGLGDAQPSLYPENPRGEYAWGMTIDLDACIGCKACTIACQAENNIPTVGAEEVARGREMHWIRVDRYYDGEVDDPKMRHQPVPCMHCEHAPCELVCPVGATVHDSDGLNVQVYNRCIGTRFCSNNCPYKVRRFNFLQYADLENANLEAARNPDVTVRNRGVMEKCTYCIQRIRQAHIAADRESRPIRDGEVLTACQAVCPAAAISFGNLSDAKSGVVERRRSRRHYALLEDLNTRPRTTYLARLSNPNPDIGRKA